MAKPEIEFVHPVAWPAGRPRTQPDQRKDALWRDAGKRITFDVAVKRLRDQIDAITPTGRNWRVLEQTLSTNYDLRADGRPRRDRGAPSDPAVAFFFELDGQPHVLACDRWSSVADNIAAIAAHIEALRGQERWGVADMKQAFAGHVALPAPEQWCQVLGLKPGATAAEINAAWRERANTAHPDKPGGSDAAMARLNAARDDGLRAMK
ncbi:MAG TPA: J domain-containing protein [Allosphingosinicella sp.]|jgi:hypothetical protein